MQQHDLPRPVAGQFEITKRAILASRAIGNKSSRDVAEFRVRSGIHKSQHPAGDRIAALIEKVTADKSERLRLVLLNLHRDGQRRAGIRAELADDIRAVGFCGGCAGFEDDLSQQRSRRSVHPITRNGAMPRFDVPPCATLKAA